MKANELRIGNKLLFCNGIEPKRIVTVNARFFSSLAAGRPTEELKNNEDISNYYSGIPLTPKILEDFGFKLHKSKDFYTIHRDLISFIFSESGQLVSTFVYGDTVFRRIDYLHDLQNLYFTLTGEDRDVNHILQKRTIE